MAMRMRYINIAPHPFQKREQNISYFQSISICSNYFIRLNSMRIGEFAEHLLHTWAAILYWEFRSHEFHWTTATNVRPILMDFSFQFLLSFNFCSCSIVCVLFGVCYVLWNGKRLPHDTRQMFWISIVESNRFSLYIFLRHFSANLGLRKSAVYRFLNLQNSHGWHWWTRFVSIINNRRNPIKIILNR